MPITPFVSSRLPVSASPSPSGACAVCKRHVAHGQHGGPIVHACPHNKRCLGGAPVTGEPCYECSSVSAQGIRRAAADRCPTCNEQSASRYHLCPHGFRCVGGAPLTGERCEACETLRSGSPLLAAFGAPIRALVFALAIMGLQSCGSDDTCADECTGLGGEAQALCECSCDPHCDLASNGGAR